MIGQRKNGGVGLVEVLVVLVILLIGIFAIVRLFPYGFLSLRQTERATLAGRLARLQVDAFIQNVANLPDAIVPVIPVAKAGAPGYAFRVDQNIHPDDLTPADSAIAGADPYYYSGINRIRRIFGETVRIPSPTPTTAGQGSVYMLSVSPIFSTEWDGTNEFIFVSGNPMQRRVQEATDPNTPFLFRPSQYAIDYESAQIGFLPAGFPRQFLVTYSYYDTNNQVQTIIDETINVAAGFEGWIALTGNGGQPLVPQSDLVARKFRRLALGDPWSHQQPTPYRDPYEFKVLSPQIGAFANPGVLLFNPLGHDHTESTPSGLQPLTARIDYDVLDWHIIREDRPMPAASPYRVNLSLKFIKVVGDYEEDQTQYIGLFRDPASPADLVVYNVSTGESLTDLTPGASFGRPLPDRNGQPSYRLFSAKEGIVEFSEAVGQDNPQATFRFFYKARGEWGMSVQKACYSYQRQTTPSLSLCHYYIPLDAADPGVRTRMYFPVMEAGKTVSIRELWYRDANGNSRKASNEAYQINANRANFENLAGQLLTYIDLKDKHPDAADWDPVPAGQAAIGVQGVSFRSRVIWTDGGVVNQTVGGNVPRIRWRKVDLDTFLTRAPQP